MTTQADRMSAETRDLGELLAEIAYKREQAKNWGQNIVTFGSGLRWSDIDALVDRLRHPAAQTDEVEEAIEQLHHWRDAYPLDIFPEPTKEQVSAAYEVTAPADVVARAAAAQGRHLWKVYGEPAANLIQSLSARCAAMEGEIAALSKENAEAHVRVGRQVTLRDEAEARAATAEAALKEARADRERVKKEIMRIGNMIDHGGMSASWASGQLLGLFQTLIDPASNTEGR